MRAARFGTTGFVEDEPILLQLLSTVRQRPTLMIMPDTNYPVHYDERYTAADSVQPAEYLIGVFDVLGFSDGIQREPLSKVAQEYRELQRHLAWSAEIPLFIMDPANPRAERWHTRNAVYSDTMILWSDTSREAAMFFVASCSILMETATQAGWPLRGAITSGECVISQEAGLFLGQPIIRGLGLEKTQDWVGVGIDTLTVDNPAYGSVVRRNTDVRAYNVPMKAGAATLHWAITWHQRDPDATRHLRKMRDSAPPTERHRYEAAIAFLLNAKDQDPAAT